MVIMGVIHGRHIAEYDRVEELGDLHIVKGTSGTTAQFFKLKPHNILSHALDPELSVENSQHNIRFHYSLIRREVHEITS